MALPTTKPGGKYYEIAALLPQLSQEWLAEFLVQIEGGVGSTITLDDVWPARNDPNALMELLRSNQ